MEPSLADWATLPPRAVLGTVIATLPRRLWNDWEGRVPVRAAALPAAVLPLLLAFAIGVPAFLEFAGGMGSTVGGAVLEAGHQANMGRKPGDAGAHVWFGMMFALPAFLFFTPMGWLCVYLGGSGVMRFLSWAADDPRGDPAIAVADTLARRWHGQRRQRREGAARRALEGEETPDILLSGRALGVPDALYVLVASRLKEGWESGVFVVSGESRLRIGARFDRRFPEGVRAVYPLREVAAAEVTRRAVLHDLPPLSEYDAVQRRIRTAPIAP